MDAPFVDNKWWGYMSCGIDTLDNYNPFTIIWLGESRPYISLKISNDFYWPNNAYLEPSLVKVVYIVVVDAILSFGFLY